MSRVLVVGSVALDTIETPAATMESILGGAATHFSLSARHFAPVRLVGIVGKDFPDAHVQKLRNAGIDLAGLQIEDGETFRWHGRYQGAMDSAETLKVDLNVFGQYRPDVPAEFRDSPFAHLGTADPQTQLKVLEQLSKPEFVMLDTIEFWIQKDRKGLLDLLPRVDALCVNYEEALLLGEKSNLPSAMQVLRSRGLRNLIVKRAEHGATLSTDDTLFSVPSYPTSTVTDPTGAGDAFAGGVLGHIARAGNLREALLYGSVMGSFAVEGFGTGGLDGATPEKIEERIKALRAMITL